MPREKTKYKSIYFNTETKKYDVKYNFKEYDPLTQKNKYKAKWRYNIPTLTEARKELALLQSGGFLEESKEITLGAMFEVWKKEAEADNRTIATVRNTQQQLKMISQFIPLETKLKDITEDVYNSLIAQARKKGYSQETLHNINACFRKLIRLAYRKDLITVNILEKTKNKSFKVSVPLDEYSSKFITKDEFRLIDKYFTENSFVRLGFDRYKKFRLLFNFLYYSGCRIGEVLALTVGDFKVEGFKQGVPEGNLDIADSEVFQVRIEKVLLTEKHETIIRYETKNKKNRIIPLPENFMELFTDYLIYLAECGIIISNDYRVFDFTEGTALYMLKKAIKETGIRDHAVHDFRHTFISNLINLGVSLPEIEQFSGDTQQTIFKRYSHSTESSKQNLLKAQRKF